MRSVVVALLFFGAVLAVSEAADIYTTKYDDLNIDNILNNRRLVNNYVNCILSKGKCNEEGKTLKEIIPDALKTDCVKCNEKQRTNVEKIVKFLVKNRRAQFNELAADFDPNGEYRAKYQKYLE